MVKLYDVASIRDKAREVVEPLRTDGINRFEAHVDGMSPLVVERDAFDIDEGPDEELGEQVLTNVLLTIMKPSFSDRRWRLTVGADGDAFWAEMRDESCLARVAAGETFQAGDRLRADLRMVQSETPSGRLKIARYVQNVTDHIRQFRLGEDEAG